MVRPLSLLTYLIWALVASVILYDVAPLRGESPVGKQIGEITITGNRVRSRDQILSKMNLRPGAKYDQTMADEDVKRLIQEGWFLPGSVFINTAPRPDGSIQVIVGVREAERTIKEVKYVGNDHIDDEELNKLTGLRPGAPMEPGTNQDARHRIFRKYQDEGRLHTAVVLEEGGKAGDQRVVFRITEGPVVKVRRIRFQFFGERSGVVTTEKLWTLIDSASNPVTPAVGLVTYNETDLNKDEEKIKGHYQKLGFLEASVKKEVVWERDGSTVEVVYHIWEKGRFKIGEVKIEGAKSFDQQTLLSHTSARPGDYYETRLVGEDLKHIRDFYGYRGMPTQVREVQTHSKDGIVNVTYQVEEREPLRVGNIRVLGNSYTREAVVLRQLNLFPGQLLSYPELLEAQRNLQRLQIFENDPSKGGPPSVEVQDPPPGANSPYRDLVVRVA
jgi:outer membrane protein insertion porin family